MNGYRPSPFANITPVVKNLLIINIICFLPFLLFNQHTQDAYGSLFAAHYFNSPFFKPWQIITYMFMHGGFAHIFFNMFVLFSLGPILEYAIGSRRFFNFYFICGIGAVLLQLLVQAVEVYHLIGAFGVSHPELISSYEPYGQIDGLKLYDINRSSLVGASGAICGVLVAFAMIYPDMELMIIYLPIPIKAKYLVPVFLVFEVFLQVGQFGGDNVAHLAHLGGALFGFLLIKFWRLR